MSPQYPVFLCPNCRAGADLEAEIDEPNEDWEVMFDDQTKNAQTGAALVNAVESRPSDAAASATFDAVEPVDSDQMDISESEPNDAHEVEAEIVGNATSSPLPIRHSPTAARRGTPSPREPGAEGPITPRNDAGPWVLDGRAGRESPEGHGMTSLDAAATEMDLTAIGSGHSSP